MVQHSTGLGPELRERLDTAFGADVQFDADVGQLTTYRVGGSAAALITVRTEAQLATLGALVEGSGVACHVFGAGSNTLVADTGYEGLFVTLASRGASEFAEKQILHDRTQIRVGGVVLMPGLSNWCADEGLAGLGWAAGIPGTVGGSIQMNAGVGRGKEMIDVLHSARIVDLSTGEITTRPVGSLGLEYRRSNLGPLDVVVSATFNVSAGDPKELEQERTEYLTKRRKTQELTRTGGSVWRNPPDDAAFKLIKHAGCAGLRLGSARVSTRHANFIVTDKGGAAQDVYDLMCEVRQRVFAVSGVVLNAETRLVGFDPLPDPS